MNIFLLLYIFRRREKNFIRFRRDLAEWTLKEEFYSQNFLKFSLRINYEKNLFLTYLQKIFIFATMRLKYKIIKLNFVFYLETFLFTPKKFGFIWFLYQDS